MAGPKKQHTVPEFLLRRFSNNGQNLYQLKSPVDRNHWILRNVKRLSTSNHIYTIVRADGDRVFAIEQALSELEARTSDVLGYLDNNPVSQLTASQRFVLSEFMAVQLYRTVKMKDVIQNVANDLKIVGVQRDVLMTNRLEIIDLFGEAAFAEAMEQLQSGKPIAEAPPDFFPRTVFIERSRLLPDLIRSMHWRKVKIKRGIDKFFVCCDNPFTVRRRGVLTDDRVVGLGKEASAEFYFPTSKRLMLIGSHDPRKDEQATRLRVDELNKIIFANRHNYVWSPEDCQKTKVLFESVGDFRIPGPTPGNKSYD